MRRNNFNFRNKTLINVRFLCKNKLCSCHYRKQQECQTRHNNFVNDNSTICEPFLQKMERSLSTCDVITDINHNKIHTKEIGAVDDTFYNLSENDLSNLFKLDILSTDIEEIEHSINRIKLKEEMVPTIKRKCSRRDKHDIVQVKYVEANGEVEFSRKFWKLGKNFFSRSTIMVYNNDQQTVMRIIVWLL